MITTNIGRFMDDNLRDYMDNWRRVMKGKPAIKRSEYALSCQITKIPKPVYKQSTVKSSRICGHSKRKYRRIQHRFERTVLTDVFLAQVGTQIADVNQRSDDCHLDMKFSYGGKR